MKSHGRADASRTGWDGSPQGFHSLCQGSQIFSVISQICEWEEAIAVGKLEPSADVYQALVLNHNLQKLPDTSDDFGELNAKH